MKVEDLIIGQCYCVRLVNTLTYYYFRFEKFEDNKIYSYGYEIDTGVYILDTYFCDNKQFIEDNIVEETKFDKFVEFLPIGHPDKINYFRKEKIKKLCNL